MNSRVYAASLIEAIADGDPTEAATCASELAHRKADLPTLWAQLLDPPQVTKTDRTSVRPDPELWLYPCGHIGHRTGCYSRGKYGIADDLHPPEGLGELYCEGQGAWREPPDVIRSGYGPKRAIVVSRREAHVWLAWAHGKGPQPDWELLERLEHPDHARRRVS